MKYNHDFKLVEDNKTYRIYKENNNIVRLDFFKSMIRVSMYKENAYLFPTFSISPGEYQMPRHGRDKLSTEGLDTIIPNVVSKNNIDSFVIDDVTISINLHNFRMKYEIGNEVLFEDRKYFSYNFENELGEGVAHYISRYEDEEIYGLGDKSGNINKSKRRFLLETSDAMGYNALSSDPLYKQVPFYICKNKVGTYAIYYDSYANGVMDFGQEINNYYDIYKYYKSEDDSLVFYVIFGTVSELVSKFSYLTGKNMFAPKWALKYCGSTMSYTDAPDAEYRLRKFVELLKEYDIDCGGFYLSSGYTQKGIRRYVFNWNKDKIKDPKALADYYKENGISFLPNIKPAFLTDHFLYDEIAKKGWFLHYSDNTPATFPFWDGEGSYLDFTNDEAYDFWTKCVKENLIDLGYENMWNDNNEYDIKDPSVIANGFGHPISAKRIRPLFSYLMTSASLAAYKTDKRYMSVSRSGIAGLGRIAHTWTGDNNTSFDDFRGNHKIAMTYSLSSLFFFGQDIGGFAGDRPNEELFIRWLQYGVFTPRFTLHSWNKDGSSTMPWLYPNQIDTVKKIFDLRKKLMPYLYNAMYNSVEEYRPMIYPIFLNHPSYDTESDLFYLGDSIIVCPIFDKGVNTIEVKLPDDSIYYLGNQKVKENIKITQPLDQAPKYLVKEGSIIPYQIEEKIVMFIYPKNEGTITYSFFNDDGLSKNLPKPEIINVSFAEKEIIVDNSNYEYVVVSDNRQLVIR